MNFFIIGGDKQEYGPADADTVRQWIREGRANGDTLLRAENETEWRPLRTFADFVADLPPAPTPTAGAPSDGTTPKVITVSVDTPVHVTHAFARAWHLINEHFGVIAMATLMVWMALSTMLFIPIAGPIMSMIFSGPLFGGLFLLFLKLIREGQASTSDLFTLTRDNAVPLMLTSFVSAILTQVALACCCVVPGIYLQIAWLLGIPIVADRRVSFWAGLEISRRVITPNWFKFCGLFIVAFLPVLVFHYYLSGRLLNDLSPYFSEMMRLFNNASAGGVDKTEFEAIYKKIVEIANGYAFWGLIRQCLLLISLPFGIGSFAFVYEDLFGRKK